MQLVVVGLSHRTAPVEQREKAVLTDSAARAAVRALVADPAIDEAVALCPVGAILRKGVGYDEPIGRRRYERAPLSERALARQQGKESDDAD